MKKNKKSGILPIILLAIVIVGSIVGLVLANKNRQANIENPAVVTSQDDVLRVTAKEAFDAQQNGPVIVDTRSEDQYAQQHVAGSNNIPLDHPPKTVIGISVDKNFYIEHLPQPIVSKYEYSFHDNNCGRSDRYRLFCPETGQV